MSGKPGPADGVDKQDASEHQDKTLDMYFGIFFDVHESLDDSWMSKAAKYRKDAEKWKGDFENDIRDSKAYKIAEIVEGTAKSIIDVLPDNPVSNVIKQGLAMKDTIVGCKDQAEGLIDSATGALDSVTNTITGQEYFDVSSFDNIAGAKYSIVFKMEPVYRGGGSQAEGDDVFTVFVHRIYAQGSRFVEDFRPKKPGEEEQSPISDEWRQQLSDEAAAQALQQIKNKLDAAPNAKLALHFDLFGHADDASMDKLEPEINDLQGSYANITSVKIDYKGKYKNLYDVNEVRSDLGGTVARFRETTFLDV
ncbi:MAG: hypothetical protein FWG84_06850 [Bacteroidales bacterium]|nr:hypothetical protein [Bacteroidales bacterium]